MAQLSCSNFSWSTCSFQRFFRFETFLGIWILSSLYLIGVLCLIATIPPEFYLDQVLQDLFWLKFLLLVWRNSLAIFNLSPPQIVAQNRSTTHHEKACLPLILEQLNRSSCKTLNDYNVTRCVFSSVSFDTALDRNPLWVLVYFKHVTYISTALQSWATFMGKNWRSGKKSFSAHALRTKENCTIFPSTTCVSSLLSCSHASTFLSLSPSSISLTSLIVSTPLFVLLVVVCVLVPAGIMSVHHPAMPHVRPTRRIQNLQDSLLNID